jgi:hypothetical protein
METALYTVSALFSVHLSNTFNATAVQIGIFGFNNAQGFLGWR